MNTRKCVLIVFEEILHLPTILTLIKLGLENLLNLVKNIIKYLQPTAPKKKTLWFATNCISGKLKIVTFESRSREDLGKAKTENNHHKRQKPQNYNCHYKIKSKIKERKYLSH